METGVKEGTASRSLPGQSPRAFPHRSPPAAANLAHLYRVNISPSFQRPGPRETDSHLQPPLPSPPRLHPPQAAGSHYQEADKVQGWRGASLAGSCDERQRPAGCL